MILQLFGSLWSLSGVKTPFSLGQSQPGNRETDQPFGGESAAPGLVVPGITEAHVPGEKQDNLGEEPGSPGSFTPPLETRVSAPNSLVTGRSSTPKPDMWGTCCHA